MRGWSIVPSKPSAKLALFSLLFFGTLMFWHWEAMLISHLATRVKVMPFNGIPDLVSNTGNLKHSIHTNHFFSLFCLDIDGTFKVLSYNMTLFFNLSLTHNYTKLQKTPFRPLAAVAMATV